MEQRVYQKAASDNARSAPKTHIWEIFAGTAQITKQALDMGLSAYQPIDSRYGETLTKTSTREILEVLRPPRGVLLTCLEFPCTLWSILNWNCNYVDDRELLLSLQEGVKWQVQLCITAAKVQMEEQNFFSHREPCKLPSLARRDGAGVPA